MKYIAFYDTEDFKYENRSVAPSALNVVKYMADTMVKSRNDVEIISPSRTLNAKGYYSGRKTVVGNHEILYQPPTFGVQSKMGRCFSVLWTRVWLLCFLLRNVKKYEEIVVYHSAAFMNIIKLVKQIKKLRLIMEIREIYGDAKNDLRIRKKELKYFDIADGYIFPTALMNQDINKQEKPSIIATGIYKYEANENRRFKDNKIHLVYAGTFENSKNGAGNSIDAAEFLGSDYHMHILGYGTKEMVENIKSKITEVSQKTKCIITYDGLKSGKEFNNFLQQCDIGMSVQNPGQYNDTSFPSKVFTYMTNGLKVISNRIPAVEQSAVGKYVVYVDDVEPHKIAEQIRNIGRIRETDNKKLFEELDEKLVEDITELLRKVKEIET